MSGISQHSKNANYIIFSVYRKGAQQITNENIHYDVKYSLKINEIPFKELKGVYKGEEEQSLITQYSFKLLSTILKKYKQQSVLLLSNYKHGLYEATLVYKKKKENLGYFRQVSKEIAEKQDSYTTDGDNYYICTKSDETMSGELVKLNLK